MIVIGQKSLREVLQSPIAGEPDSSFCVPMFQRKYDWEKEKEVARLVDDIFDDLERPSFMGTLMFVRRSNTEMEIVDGQQRLATFAIFYRVFVDYAGRRRQDTALTGQQAKELEDLQHDMKQRIVSRRRRKPVIKLSSKINDYFQNEIILSDDENKIENMRSVVRGQHPSVKRLRNAYIKIFEAFERECGSLQGEELMDKLNKISDALELKQTFISLTVDDEFDAYTVFETINERGKRLTLSDLVKNLCFRKMKDLNEDDLEAFSNKWDEAEESLVSDFGSFLWHVWVSRYGTCPKNKTFKQISDSLKEIDSTEVFDFSTEMIFDESQWYYTYEHPNVDAEKDEKSKKKMRNFEMLNCMRATRCYPLLLGIDYALLKKGSITATQANDIITTLTALTFWHSGICERDARHLEKIYHKLANKIRETCPEEANQVVSEIISALHAEFPSKEDCHHDFRTKTFSDSSFIKGLLRNLELQKTIEVHGHEGEKTLLSNQAVWLEHILPQNPEKDSAWMASFPDKSERDEYTYKLGNQTLLAGTLDRKALNKPLEEKKTLCYSKSQIELTKDLLKAEEWNAKEIDQRTEKLFDLAKKVWPIPRA